MGGQNGAAATAEPQWSVIDRLHRLRDRVADGEGDLPRHVRRAAASGGPVPVDARAYAEKVRRNAYEVVDGDIDNLKAQAWSEDEIYELTVAIAVDAGLSRLDRARRVLEEAEG